MKRMSTILREMGQPKPPKDDGKEDPRKLLNDKKGKDEKIAGDKDPVALHPQLQEAKHPPEVAARIKDLRGFEPPALGRIHLHAVRKGDMVTQQAVKHLLKGTGYQPDIKEEEEIEESGDYSPGSYRRLTADYHGDLRKLGVEPHHLEYGHYTKGAGIHQDYGKRGLKLFLRNYGYIKHKKMFGEAHVHKSQYRLKVVHSDPGDGKPGKDGKRPPEPKKKTTIVSASAFRPEGARHAVHTHFQTLGQIVHSVEHVPGNK